MKREGATFSIRDRATRPSTLFAFALTALLLFALWNAARARTASPLLSPLPHVSAH